MAKIISFSNEKGGIGKTTATINVAKVLAKKGYKALVVDLDGQCSASKALGFVKDKKPTVADLIYDTVSGRQTSYEDYIRQSENGVFYIPASQMLSTAVSNLGVAENSSFVLKEIFKDEFFSQYDFILFDCRTLLDLLVQNALNASEYVVIPEMPTVFGFDSLEEFLGKIEKRKNETNAKLKVLGILYNNRPNTAIADDIIASARDIYGELIFKRVINATPAQAEKMVLGERVKGSFADGFTAITEDILERIYENDTTFEIK